MLEYRPMKPEYSPGPWQAVIEDGPSGTSVKVVDKNGAVICLCKTAQGNKIENGQFIAAGPAMFAELRRLAEKYGNPETQDVVALVTGARSRVPE
jgi:hypothetical protein